MKEVQKMIDTYENFWKAVRQFDGIKATEFRRKELSGLLKKYVDQKEVFIRRDVEEDGIKIIELHCHELHYNMAAAVTINLIDGKFSICEDRLIATLEGLYEQLNEMKEDVQPDHFIY